MLFPCWFGAALQTGGRGRPAGRVGYAIPARPRRLDAFGARVFKLSQDEQGTRLTWLRVTGGSFEGKGPAHRRKRRRPLGGKGQPAAALLRCEVYAGGGSGPRTGVCRHRPDPGPPRRGAGCRAGQRPACAGAGAQLSGAAARGGGHPRRAAASCTGWKRRSPSSMWSGTRRWARSMCSSWARCSWKCSKACSAERFGLEVEFGPGGILYKETIAERRGGRGPLRAPAPLCRGASQAGTPARAAAGCSLPPTAGKKCWTKTGSGWC